MERVIMQFEGRDRGPLFLVFAALHGNEHAGIRALQLVHKMLDVEHITNPGFRFRGRMVGILGNIAATKEKVRFIDEDLNRIWNPERIEDIKKKPSDKCNVEERELKELLSEVHRQIAAYDPTELIVLDLHTTSSHGGIFVIPNEEKRSLELAKNLHAPVILNMLSGISGTTLHYFNKDFLRDVTTTTITFEAGQHDDTLSVNRCIAAIVNCLRSIKCVLPTDVENIHDQLLISYSRNLPKVSRLLYKHDVTSKDDFTMNPGFENFERIRRGRILGRDSNGAIIAESDGMILMPLYQQKGNEGFFIIEQVSL